MTHRDPLLLLTVLVAAAAAQNHCDPVSQYEQDGRCCSKCGPGTSMVSSSCEDPQCKACEDDEYQETYTTSSRCLLQPYCDPNKNFVWPVQLSPTKRSSCLCLDGFHCSGDDCLTCVPHRTCPQGSGAQSKGNQTHDTVCQECPDGSFSDETSWDGVCRTWTLCADGFRVVQEGTKVSDTACEEGESRTSTVVILLVVFAVILLVSAVACWRKGGKRMFHEGKLKSCFQVCAEEKAELPTDPELGKLKTPVETEEEDQLSLGRTAKGNVVVQEHGKEEVLSREEEEEEDTQDSFSRETDTLALRSV